MTEETTNKGIIYGLIDPIYGIIRYVGKSEQRLEDRICGHISEARYSKKNYRRLRWFRELFSINLQPKPVLLEYNIPEEKLGEEEDYFISITKEECAQFGIECINKNKGGGGGRHKRLTKEREEEICKEYTINKNIADIRRKFRYSYYRIASVLKSHNVFTKSDHRKYIINENYFQTINTEDKAYNLGIVFAHGTVQNSIKNHHYHAGVQFAIPNTDEIILINLLKSMNGNYPITHITDKKGKQYSRLCIWSKQVATDLLKLGCSAHKNKTLNWPSDNTIPDHLRHHFLRGYIDGGGSMFQSKYRPSNCYVSLRSSHNFCIKTQEWLINKCNFDKTKIQFNRGSWELRYSGKQQVSKMWYLLYDSATVYLPRKKNVHNIFSVNKIPKLKGNRKLTKDDIKNIILSYEQGTIRKLIENKYNISNVTLDKVLKKYNIKHRYMTANEHLAVINSYKNGDKINDMCKKFNIKFSTVYYILEKNNVPRRLKKIIDYNITPIMSVLTFANSNIEEDGQVIIPESSESIMELSVNVYVIDPTE
jgi:hypothetical protein